MATKKSSTKTVSRRPAVKTKRTVKRPARPAAKKAAPRRARQRVLAMVGTRKGAFVFEAGSERSKWKMSGPHFAGWAVQHMVHDPRSGMLFAAIYHEVYGANIHRSTDLGATWQMAEGPAFTPDAGLTLKRVWRVEPGHASRPNEVWAGADPGALFKSEDGGQTWRSVPGLTNHPSRDQWFPGAGGLMVHSILPHPTNPDRLYVAISAAGVFRSDDGGQTWAPKNHNTHACFMPEGQQWPEVGQCCHHLVLSSTEPDLLFQQNHCGVYRSEDGGDNWTAIHGGLPSEFGFAIGVLPHKARTIYTVPEISSDYRYTPEGAFTVYRSRDGGDNWEKLTRGLPKTGAFLAVFREGVAVDDFQPGGVYVGTSTGQLFHSRDEGARWRMLADNLPPIYSVTTAVLA